jgi:CrcB protein
VRGAVREQGDVLAVIAIGGALGSLGRWGVARALPHRPGEFPWSTVTVNLVGCLAIGALMIVVLEVAPPSRYLRPLLGTGVLGGFTTFSTYALDAAALVDAHRWPVALFSLVGTVIGGLGAVWLGAVLARLVTSAGTARPDPLDSFRPTDPDDPPGSPS